MLSRRDVLLTFLGASATQLACRSHVTIPAIPGALADSFLETGHLLRGPPLPRAERESGTFDVIVVGGGAAGLSAAWRLAGDGLHDFIVCELDDVLGGTARNGQNAVSRFPWGAHYLPAPLTMSGPVPRLLKELGAIVGVEEDGSPRFAEQMLVREPEERLFYKGTWYEGLYLRAGASPEDLQELSLFESLMRDFASARDGKGRKAFCVPISAGSDDAEWTALDSMSMAQWLDDHAFRSPRLRWMVDYACRDDYGATAADTSAWAGIWYFTSRQTGAEKNDGYLSWPEGNGRLIRELAGSLGPEQLRQDCLVHAIEPVTGSSDWSVHSVDAKTRAPAKWRARHVVLAAPRHVAAHVVGPWSAPDAKPAFLAEFQSSPWVVANLTLSEHPRSRGFPLAWDNVLYDSKSLGYVVATHQSPRADEHGPTVLTWYCPLTGSNVVDERKKLLASTYEDWAHIIMGDLAPAHLGLQKIVERIDVVRWGHAMVRPRPGFMWGAARLAAQQSLGTLHFAHTDLSGMALFEEANWHGVRAAETALTGLGRTSPSWR